MPIGRIFLRFWNILYYVIYILQETKIEEEWKEDVRNFLLVLRAHLFNCLFFERNYYSSNAIVKRALDLWTVCVMMIWESTTNCDTFDQFWRKQILKMKKKINEREKKKKTIEKKRIQICFLWIVHLHLKPFLSLTFRSTGGAQH